MPDRSTKKRPLWMQRGSDYLRRRFTDAQRFLILSIIAGVLCGLTAVAFHLCIDAVFSFVFTSVRGFGGITGFILLMPLVTALAGLIAGLIIWKISPSAVGSGIPQTKSAYYQNFGIMRFRDGFWRFIAGTISVGGGLSLGREGPTVHICSCLASSIGQWAGLAKQRVQAMVPIGMGAGIAAAFNTPMAAVFFVFEKLLGDFSSKSFFGIMVAVVIAAVTERMILGEHPAFALGVTHFGTEWWMLMAIPLAMVAGGVGHYFVTWLLELRIFVRERISLAPWLKPAAGGLLVGLIGVTAYLLTAGRNGVFAIGYHDLADALNGRLTLIGVILVLFIGKFVATLIAYTSGGSGGVFAPTLFLGGMLGALVGTLGQMVFGYSESAVAGIALLGMGAFFAAVIRCPMTSIVMVFELTLNYSLILPLMVGNILAYAIATRLRPVPIYDALLVQDKINLRKLPTYQGQQDWRNLPISTIMTFEVHAVQGDLTARANLNMLGTVRHHAYPVLDGAGKLIGVVTRHELEEANREKPDRHVRDLLTHSEPVVVTPDTSIRDVANTLVVEDVLQAPVVQAGDRSRVVGFVTLHDIARQQNAINDQIGR